MLARRTQPDPQTARRIDTEQEHGRDGDRVRHRELRNGVPLVRPYRYGAPRPRFAIEAIRRAEAEHGAPPADDRAYRRRSHPQAA
jgi:hypothetical protein